MVRPALTLLLCASLSLVCAQSFSPPGGLDAEECPQFVVIGFDDNAEPAGMQWILDFLADKTNSPGSGSEATFDGSPARVSFYCTGEYFPAMDGTVLSAWENGHEIGNHTQTHPHGKDFSAAEWRSEMEDCNATIANCGVPVDEIVGFRTPFLEWGAGTMDAVREEGFTYDCSIEDEPEGESFPWPYDNDGIWELPNSPVITEYGESVVGFDYNMWVQSSIGGKEMNGEEFLATLKNTLDIRLGDNRAPMMFGAHTQNYLDDYTQYTPNADTDERRAAIEDFLDYALSKPDVRVIPARDIVAWCRNPVPLGGGSATSMKTSGNADAFSASVCAGKLQVSVPAGSKVLEVLSLDGTRLRSFAVPARGNAELSLDGLAPGAYLCRLMLQGSSVSRKIAVL